MDWSIQEKLLDMPVGPSLPVTILVGQNGIEVELRETRDGWYIYLCNADLRLRFFASRYCPRGAAASVEPNQLGPICGVAHDAKFGGRNLDEISREQVANWIKDALKNVWRLKNAPQVKVTTVRFSSPTFLQFNDV